MNDFVIKTPIALLLFNRPESTKRVFSAIRTVKPSQLFIVGDGPRHNRIDDVELVSRTRKILEEIDWICEVRVNFSEINLGCKKRVSTGIDWVFEHVEEAIFLEDDCLPDLSFFRFCEELLKQYKNDKSIGMISGSQLLRSDLLPQTNSYFFSKHFFIWGWATWKDRWVDSYDVNMSDWAKIKNEEDIFSLIGNKNATSYWKHNFDQVSSGKIDTWDYQWVFANWVKKRVCIVAAKNLVSNIGFGVNATHTKRISKFAKIQAENIMFPLIHPPRVSIDDDLEIDIYNYIYKPSLLSLLRKYLTLFSRNLVMYIKSIKIVVFISIFKLPRR